MLEALIGIPTAIVIAAVSSWITVQLSLRRFRSERWWERKADTYAKVLEALHHSKEFSDRHMAARMAGRELSEETDTELGEKARAGTAEIRRVTNMGAFLLSDQAMQRLKKIEKEEKIAQEVQTWDEHLVLSLNAVSSCLDDFIKIAKEDLKV